MKQVLLYGAGRIAHKHLEAVNKIGDVDVKVVEKCPSTRNSFAQMYDVDCYSTIDEIGEQYKPDIISILTESGNHFSDIIKLAQYSKVLLVEKPVCLNLNEARIIRERLSDDVKKIFVVHQNRLNLPIQFCKEVITEGRLGKITNVVVNLLWCRDSDYYDQANWRGTKKMDGGVLSNQAIHHLDLIRFLFGEIKTVAALSTSALAQIECEDSISCALITESGALVSLHASTAARPKNVEASIKLLGSLGYLEIGGTAANELINCSLADVNLEAYAEDISSVYGNGHSRVYNEIFNRLDGENICQITTFEDAVNSIKVLNAIYTSNQEKKAILLDEHTGVSDIGFLG